ncbi:Carrier protein, mitochondrial [Umbelopsis sp. WA50703]
MSIPATIIYFVGYDAVRDKTRQHIGEQSLLYQYSPLWAGGVARTFAAFFISPIELFRTRMQSVDGVNGFRSVLSGVQTMVKQHGPSSLWRGLVPTMWRDVPFSAFYWMSYEKSRSLLVAKMEMNHSSGPVDAMTEFKMAFAAGAISGMIAAVLTTPFDVVKTRLQVGSREERRMLNSIKDILNTEGIRGLYRGCIPRLAKIAPSCAIMISSYELGKMFFARKRAQEQRPNAGLTTQ